MPAVVEDGVGERGSGEPVRLFCFAHAGGGATVFRLWTSLLAPDVDVHPVVLPGRESRWAERAHAHMDTLLDCLTRELRPLTTASFAVYGHSTGAAVAYGLCVRLSADGIRPLRLFVSGRRPPHLPARTRPVHLLGDDELLAYVRSLGGLPQTLPDDLVRAFLPVIRADFQVNETCTAATALEIPISAFSGERDPLVTTAELLAWGELTSAGFRGRVLPGGHFSLLQAPGAVHAAIRHDLTSAHARTE